MAAQQTLPRLFSGPFSQYYSPKKFKRRQPGTARNVE